MVNWPISRIKSPPVIKPTRPQIFPLTPPRPRASHLRRSAPCSSRPPVAAGATAPPSAARVSLLPRSGRRCRATRRPPPHSPSSVGSLPAPVSSPFPYVLSASGDGSHLQVPGAGGHKIRRREGAPAPRRRLLLLLRQDPAPRRAAPPGLVPIFVLGFDHDVPEFGSIPGDDFWGIGSC